MRLLGFGRDEPVLEIAESDRLGRYRRYLAFDAGTHDVGRLAAGQAVVTANYARIFVRKGASYLFPEPVTAAVDPAGDGHDARRAAARAEATLATCAKENDLATLDLETAIDAGVLGDGAFKVTWDAGRERVRIVPVDPCTLAVETAPDNYREVVGVRQAMEMPATAVAARYDVAVAGPVTVIEEWTVDRLVVRMGRRARQYVNPYGFIPFVIFPNTPRPHQFWGESDLESLIVLNKALDRRLSVIGSLLELSGNPVTVLENITEWRSMTVAPGAVWQLPLGSSAKVLNMLEGNVIQQHLAYVELLYQAMHDVSEMPRPSFGEGGTANSGVALEFLMQSLIQKIKRKRLIWTRVLVQRARMSLLLYQRFGGLHLGDYRVEDLHIRPVWPPMLPTDRQAAVEEETALHDAGLVSAETAERALGLDPDVEQALIAAEAAPQE